jgi:hypothetical protein
MSLLTKYAPVRVRLMGASARSVLLQELKARRRADDGQAPVAEYNHGPAEWVPWSQLHPDDAALLREAPVGGAYAVWIVRTFAEKAGWA